MSNEKLQIGKAGEIGSELLREVLRLDTEERSALVTLLQGMLSKDIECMITQEIVESWLAQMRACVKLWEGEEKAAREHMEEMKRRDKLPHSEKIEYIVSQMGGVLQCWHPEFIKEVLERVLAGEKVQANWIKSKDSKAYLLGKLNHIFEGCSLSLRKEVIEKYLAEVMPQLEAQFQHDEDEQNAIDEYIALINPLSPEETRELTERIRAELLAV